ncbi:MAG TPA: LPXTG cell wall anchor domain-containing protein [Acidimicrobiales bacterium]
MVRRTLAAVGIAFALLVLVAPAASAQYVDPDIVTRDDAGASDPGTALPRTGSDTETLWRVGIVLLAAGGVLVLTTRKRTAKVHVDA